MSDALQLEYSFAYLLEKGIGDRGGLHDADVFRSGSYETIGELLSASADHLEERLGRLNFAAAESENGGASAVSSNRVSR